MSAEERRIRIGDRLSWTDRSGNQICATISDFVDVRCCGQKKPGVMAIDHEGVAYVSLEHIAPDVKEGEWKANFDGHNFGKRQESN